MYSLIKIRSPLSFAFQLHSIVLLSLMPVLAIAAESNLTQSDFNSPTFDAGLNVDSLLQVAIALISVICVIFILSIILKKFNILPGTSTGLIKIIGGISLGGKDRLVLIQVGDEQILISASPSGVNKIHQLGVSIETEALSSTSNKNESGFAGLLKSVTSRSGT